MKIQSLANHAFTITTSEGEYLVSYDKVIVFRPNNNIDKVLLDEKYWDYSRITASHRHAFLRESKDAVLKKIDTGEYLLADLNSW